MDQTLTVVAVGCFNSRSQLWKLAAVVIFNWLMFAYLLDSKCALWYSWINVLYFSLGRFLCSRKPVVVKVYSSSLGLLAVPQTHWQETPFCSTSSLYHVYEKKPIQQSLNETLFEELLSLHTILLNYGFQEPTHKMKGGLRIVSCA